LETFGLLQRCQITTLNIFDKRYFKRFGIGEFSNQRRNFMQARDLRGTPSPLTSDDFHSVAAIRHSAQQNWLQDTSFTDTLGQRFQLGLVEGPSGLSGPRFNVFYRNVARLPETVDLRDIIFVIAQQGRQAAPELPPFPPATRCAVIAHAARLRSRLITSLARWI
jgi:hypothetical protein